MEFPFEITPRVIAHLGEDLIKNESIALIELVKNSYDAGASYCKVEFHFEGDALESITIKDDGCGMDLATVKNIWLVVGTDNKKDAITKISSNGRMPLGEKGIGRLGVHKLGKIIKMYTKQSDKPEVSVFIDWSKLETSQHIDDFKVTVKEGITSIWGNDHGTEIIVNELKGGWDRRKLRAVYRDLMSLNSPFSKKNDSFKVEILSNSTVFYGLPSVEELLNVGMYIGHCVIRKNRIINFKYEFRPWKQLDKIDSRIVEHLEPHEELLYHKCETIDNKGRSKNEMKEFSLEKYNIGDIIFDVVIFEKDVSVFSLINMERKIFNDYLKENGGIRVYRDDVRVYNYGEKDNDWLGLDYRRVKRAGDNISNNIVIGAVSLDRRYSYDLKEKTNREGFIENDAYFAFVDAVTYALDLIVKRRNFDKNRLMSVYKEKKQVIEPVISDLAQVMDIVEKRVANVEDKELIMHYLVRINKQYKEVRDVLIKSANAGLNLGVVIHEIEKQVDALVNYAEIGNTEKIKSISLHLERIIAGYTVLLSSSTIRETDVSQIVEIVLKNSGFRFYDHHIKIYSNRKKISFKAMLSKTEAIASLTNLIDNSIYWVSVSRDENNRMIYVFITDEIENYITVAVCDNGPGFKIPPEMAMEPFVTDKPLGIGMGLGLHITNEVMKAMNGELKIFDKNDLDLPNTAKNNGIDKAIVALCFPKAK